MKTYRLETAVSASGALQYSVFLLLEKVRGSGLWGIALKDGGRIPRECITLLQDVSLGSADAHEAWLVRTA